MPPRPVPSAYLITFATYGTWVHGRNSGSVDREHNTIGTPFVPSDAELRTLAMNLLSESPYLLSLAAGTAAVGAVNGVCRHRGWTAHAIHARTNHIHIVAAGNADPNKMMSDFKAYATRKLKAITPRRHFWTTGGSTIFLWDDDAVTGAVDYVLRRQGRPMACYPAADAIPSEPEA